MSELGLCLSKPFLGLLTSDLGRDVAAGAAITDEAAIAVEKGLATDFNGDRRSVWPNDPVDKAAERLVCFMSGDMGAPFLGIFRDVTRKVPPPSSERLGPRDAQSAEAFRECNESVVRASLPKPVRGRVSAKSRKRCSFSRSACSTRLRSVFSTRNASLLVSSSRTVRLNWSRARRSDSAAPR
jgi:hypothetical protein